MAESIQEMYKKARAAFKTVEFWEQDRVDEMCAAVGWELQKEDTAKELARLAVDESGIGVYDDKVHKIQNKTRGIMRDMVGPRTCGLVEEDKAKGIRIYAKPMGVIGALAPSTNPEATPVIKAIHAVKGRNSIVIAPHPRAKLTNKKIVDLIRDALVKLGAPADLVIGIETPTLELTNELMQQCDRVLATGGGAMVNAAYSSGTPALGVGVGNAVITVDETADLDDAAEKIRLSKTLDLAASCSADNSVVVVEKVFEDMTEKLQAQGGYVVSEEEKAKLQNTLWDDEGHLNTAIVAQPAEKIAEMAGLSVPEDIQFYIVPEEGWGSTHPFSGEKLSVVMALYKAQDIDHAIELTNSIQGYQGQGHSCGIYSNSDENIMKLANSTKTSRVMVNQPQAASNSGNLWNGMRQTFSLGCGSWGGNGTNNNISWRDLINETWVSKPLEQTKELVDDSELFGDVIDKLGD